MQERQQQAQQEQLQAQQQQAELVAQQKQAELEQRERANIRDNETRVLVAEITADGYRDTFGDDGIQDNSTQDKQKLLEDMRQFDEKMKIERDKLNLEKDKLNETKFKNRQDASLKRMQINKQSKTTSNNK